ncbi:MAG: NAD(P)-dependent oxidoreductase [Pseudomonadota bacterium]
MTILITGAEGFVGRNLVQELLLKDYSLLYPTRAELNLVDELMVKEYFKNHEITHIIHAATTLRDGTSYPPDTCENNLRMFFNLQKFKHPGAILINLGSGSEYSRSHWHRKMSEDFFDEQIPQDPHSYAKYLISKYILEKEDDTLVSLRIFGVYGKYEDYRYKFISNAIVKNILHLPIVINQNVIYDYLCVSDLGRIVEYFIKNRSNHRVLNATPVNSIDLIRIANIINQISNYKSEIHVLNDGVGIEYSGDNSRLMSEIGDFKFTDEVISINSLREYYLETQESLDFSAIEADDYLSYAKDLRQKYFGKNNDK